MSRPVFQLFILFTLSYISQKQGSLWK